MIPKIDKTFSKHLLFLIHTTVISYLLISIPLHKKLNEKMVLKLMVYRNQLNERTEFYILNFIYGILGNLPGGRSDFDRRQFLADAIFPAAVFIFMWKEALGLW